MTIKKVLSLAYVLIALGALNATAADTQPPDKQPTNIKRSTTKNKARNFNPFDVQQRTRLKINRFGVFTRVPISAAAASASVVSQPAADVQVLSNLPASTASQTTTATTIAPTAPTSTATATTANTGSVASTQMISAITSTISPATAVGTGSTLIASSSIYMPAATAASMPMSIRPPFRPPVRSPFRPPPRPPF